MSGTYSLLRDFWPRPDGNVPPKELELKFLYIYIKKTKTV